MNTTLGHYHEQTLYWIEGVGIASVGAIGIGINLFAIWKLSFGQDKAERHCFHHLLLSLSICDLTHIIFNFICFALPHLSEAYRENVLLYTIPFLIPLAQMSLSCSSFTTVALTVERYISICWPFLRYRFEIKASYYIWSVVTFSVIYNTPRFFEWQTYSEAIQRPCLSELYKVPGVNGIGSVTQMQAHANFTYPIPEMDLLNALDDAALEQIIFAEKESDYEVYVDHPSNTVFDYDVSFDTDIPSSNCTETYWNVTLIPRSLRLNHHYKVVYMNWMNFLVNLMLPLGVLLYMNIAIYKGMKRLHASSSKATYGVNGSLLQGTAMSNLRTQKTDLEVPSHSPSHGHIPGQVSVLNVSENEEERERDARFTRASVLIVVAFGLCHTLRLITNFIEMFCERLSLPRWFEVMVCVNHLLVTINSSFNFLIFLMSAKRKRRACPSSHTNTESSYVYSRNHSTSTTF